MIYMFFSGVMFLLGVMQQVCGKHILNNPIKKNLVGKNLVGGKNLIGKSGNLYVPRTDKQKIYADYLSNNSIPLVLGLGPAGCGKTLFACNAAISALRSGSVDRVVLTRPIVTADEDLGFLPGSIEMKMSPWTRPIFDILGEFFSQAQIHAMVHNNIVEISPLAYMRGRTFKRAFIIADEMQNSTPNQMLMMTTRLGEGSRMVITGDLKQSDLTCANGLADMVGRLRRRGIDDTSDLIRFIEMECQDIQRSQVVSYLIDLYDDSTKKESSRSDDKSNKNITKDPIWDIFPNDAAMIPKSQVKPLKK